MLFWEYITCQVIWSIYILILECFSSLLIYFSKLIFKVCYFFFSFFSLTFSFSVFLYTQTLFFCFIMCRMKRSSSDVVLAKSNVMSGSEASRRALADHGYAAPSPQASRRRHASLPADATASTWVPPVVPVFAGPPAKRRRRDTMTSQFAESDVASGDSYHTPNSAVYYTPPDARSLASVDGPLDPFQSQVAASTPRQMGTGNSQVSFSRGHTHSGPSEKLC